MPTARNWMLKRGNCDRELAKAQALPFQQIFLEH